MGKVETKEGKKCYIYSRVSTSMQVEGYSLDAQVERMRRYADYEGMLIAGTYSDEGKSGKSIEGRGGFLDMLGDIECKKDNVSFVLVYKLSRFGRNAADVLNSLKRMQRYGVNLICVEESIDSSKDSGKLMISVLSAVAEIERENILAQTMEGRRQKAREGKWNGGAAPYGYRLEKGMLVVEEDEKGIIWGIFDKFVNTNMGINAIAKDLNLRGVKKKTKQNGTSEEFSAHFVRRVLDNPVYAGKIAYGRRTRERVEGTDNEYHTVNTGDYILVDGEHEPIIDGDTWEGACRKRRETGGRQETIYHKGRRHLLSSILKCPVCGANMYGNVNRKKNKDGSIYSEYYYYMCKHRKSVEAYKGKCSYSKQWREDQVDKAVEQVITRLVKSEKFGDKLRERIGGKIDTDEIDKTISEYQKQLATVKRKLSRCQDRLDSLQYEDRHYERKSKEYDRRIDGFYDEIDNYESLIEEAKERRRGIQMNAITVDNIYKYLIFFDKLYDRMNDSEKKQLLESFISAVYIYEEEQESGQFLRKIDFKFPVFYDGEFIDSISWDKNEHVETIVSIQKKNS
ncbi:recombinase family protein [Lachnospiraceae bacterium 45-W7]